MAEFDELQNTEVDEAKSDDLEKTNILDELSPEERQEHFINKTKLISKILRYKELFPTYLNAYDFKLQELDKLEIKELEYLLQEISIIINTRNSSGLTKLLYFESLSIAEKISPIIGLRISGLRNALDSNQQIHDVLNELSLKYENDMYLSPEVRLCYLTSSTILQLHKLNTNANVITDFLKKPVPEKKLTEYNDL